MTVMPEPQHARSADARDTTAIAAWAVLLGLGGTQITFNVADALRDASPSPVRILAGVAPVAAAVLLSHLASSRHAAEWFRWVVGAVMLVSMAVSIGATIQVTAPALHELWREIALGVALDAASLLALWFIMDRHGAKAAAAAAVEQAQAAVQAAEERARAAQSQAREAIAEATARADEVSAESAGTQERLDAATTELAAVRAELQGLRSGLNKRRSSGRKSPRSSGARKPASSGDSSAPEDSLTTEARALTILAEEPDISGRELGLRLGGLTESYGCRLKRDLAPVAGSSESEAQS